MPKVKQPIRVGEYRPIDWCTVLYKIIFKVIGSRLKMILLDVIYSSESAFSPGRYSSHNIILAYELVKHYDRSGLSPRCVFKVDI